MNGIASLGGRFNPQATGLPRTPVMNGIQRYAGGGYVTGGGFGGMETGGGFGGEVPDLSAVSDEQLLAMAANGKIAPQVAEKIINERRMRQQPSTAMQLPMVPPAEAVNMGGPKTADVIPQGVKDWYNNTPSNPFKAPQVVEQRKELGDRMGLRNPVSTADPYAQQFESANNIPAPLTTEEANAEYARSTGKRFGAVVDAVDSVNKALPREQANEDYIREQRDYITKRRTDNPDTLTPVIPPEAGIGGLPTPPVGAASADAGGIVPQQDPMAPEAYGESPYPTIASDNTGGMIDHLPTPPGFRQGGTDPMGEDTQAGMPSKEAMEAAAGKKVTLPEKSDTRGWEALTMLGLNMMASKNPSALGALGEGGQAAVKYLGERKKEDRENKRSDQQDRRLDNAERRADRQAEQADRSLNVAERGADRADKVAEGTLKKDEALVEYYNNGGRGKAKGFTDAEKVSQARMILKEAEDRAAKAVDGVYYKSGDEKNAAMNKYKEEYLRSQGVNTKGLQQIINDAYGIGAPEGSTSAAPNGTVRKYNPKTGRIE